MTFVAGIGHRPVMQTVMRHDMFFSLLVSEATIFWVTLRAPACPFQGSSYEDGILDTDKATWQRFVQPTLPLKESGD